MRVFVGLDLGGQVLTARHAVEGAVLGQPVWGPTGLLRDLELRLGLPPVGDSLSARIPRWTARIKSLRDERAFYWRSFAVDELGTAEALLEWRDALVEAGWGGTPIAGGGDRLSALAALENHERAGMPLGRVDRLVRMERSLADAPSRIYASVTLAEDAALWPLRWRHIFECLEASGTSFSRLTTDLPGARAASDLGALQARLRGQKTSASLVGDGTLLVLRGDTPSDLAEVTAALLAAKPLADSTDVVIRCCDAESLDAALTRYGLPAQGCAAESESRPAMQVLPLAIELAFEPRDPNRVLELLTLPLGPFRGVIGSRLARAVTRQPGVGGKEWTLQRAEAAKRLHEHHARLERQQGKSDAEADRIASALVGERLQSVALWLEGVGAGASGATRAELLAVVERVRAWMKNRMRGGEIETYGSAYVQAAAFAEALALDTRERITQEEARQFLDHFARIEQRFELYDEAAGRTAHVAHPAALLAPCDRVFLWSFVAGVEHRPPRLPWNEQELAALTAAGVSFVHPSALLRAETEAWRGAVLAARERLVLVLPRTIKGTATSPHPLWDEICARLALDQSGMARITQESRDLLSASGAGLVPVAPCLPLLLPEGRGSWKVPGEVLRAPVSEKTTSVTALEKIATCPLAWVLEYRAGLRSGAMSTVATEALLNGNLSHRLVEELHREGAFDRAEDVFLTRMADLFEKLLRTEGATLLLPGASIERLQLTRQVRRAMRDLHRYLNRCGLRIAGVEEVVTTTSAIGDLHGRLDLRLVDREGRSAILDLKWSAGTYSALLESGRAVQLAAYSRAVAQSTGAPSPPAAYFAIKTGEVLSADVRMRAVRTVAGLSLEETWRRVEATAKAVLESHEHGTVHVAAAKASLPLLDALGVDGAQRDAHFAAPPQAACKYCSYDAICGRRWEALA